MSRMHLDTFEQFVEPRVLQRGKNYHRKGALLHLEIEKGDELTYYYAEVEGSSDDYEVDIAITDSGQITEAVCECPYDYGDLCKHIVTVLLEIRSKQQVSKLPQQTVTVQSALSTEEIRQNYHALGETEKRLVLILALSWETLPQTRLMQLFNQFKFKHQGRGLSSNELPYLLIHLLESGLITQEHGQLDTSEVLDEIIFDPHNSPSPDFMFIANRLHKQLREGLRWYDLQHPQWILELARLSYFAQNFELFKSYFSQIENSLAVQTSEILDKFLDLLAFEQLAPAFRSFFLERRLAAALTHLPPLQDSACSYLQNHWQELSQAEQQRFSFGMAFLSFLAGDESRVKFYLKYLNSFEGLAFSAIHMLLNGNIEGAVDFYDRLERNPQTQIPTSTGFQPIHNLFRDLAYLASQDPKKVKKIRRPGRNDMEYPAAQLGLFAVRLSLENERAAALELLKVNGNTLEVFLLLHCFYWVDVPNTKSAVLQILANETAKNGYHWISREVSALSAAILEETPLAEDRFHLYQLIPKIESWKTALDALRQLTGQQEGNQEQRVAWFVDFQRQSVQARLQINGKKGWSKGRILSLQHLFNRSVSGATPQDERFLQALNHAGGSEAFLLHTPMAWKALVDHPHLYLSRSPQTAVQLTLVQPSLIVRSEGGHYVMSFDQPVEEAGISIKKETPTRYLVIETTAQMAQVAQAFNGKKLKIPVEAEADFKEVLSGLGNILPVQSTLEDADLPKIEADPGIWVHLLPVGQGFHIELFTKPFQVVPPYVSPGKGEPFLIGLIDGKRHSTTRDLQKEKENLTQVLKQCPGLRERKPARPGLWELEDRNDCLHVLLELAPLHEQQLIRIEWPKGGTLQLDGVADLQQVQMQISGNGQWFEVNGRVEVNDELVLTLKELLEQSEAQGQFIELSNGRFLALTEQLQKQLQALQALTTSNKKSDNLQFHPLAVPSVQDFAAGIGRLQTDETFQQQEERLRTAFQQKFRLSRNFQAELRPYQREGFEWMQRCAAWGVGACLADDMGLGKTVQALAVLQSRGKLGPQLVVAPASVCRNWINECARFAPTLEPILFSEVDRQTTVRQARAQQLIVITYDLLSREAALFAEQYWTTVLLDEAQAIKNRLTKRAEAVYALPADFRLALTGTPIENHLGELWSLFQFLNPGLLGSQQAFSERFLNPIQRDSDILRREQLRRLVRPFILRRRKDEVLRELPEKTEITLTVELPPEERAFYEALRQRAIEKLAASKDEKGGAQHLRILAELMRLRRAACHPGLVDTNFPFSKGAKMEMFGEIVEELLENGHKALVFSQFVDHLQLLRQYLESKNISYQYLDGSTPGKKRQEAIDAFQAGDGAIFLISLKAGGTGLNLTAADYVIHTDPWWNPAVEDQATDRAHRIGQERPVTVYRLVAAQTIEEKILELHSQKRDLADSLLAGTDSSAKLTADELLQLLKAP